ncbi:MAG TPA: hypothetical protein DCE14_02845 [Kosmotogaceae bacterium]|nr:hypothetical protein [Kosmotogaceae bacterium]
MFYLDAETVIELNRRMILKYKEEPSLAGIVMNRPTLYYLLEIVQNDKIFPSVEAKAAFYAVRITQGHIFIQGNKRTGMASAFLFLMKNGFNISQRLSMDEIVCTSLRIAEETIDLEQVIRWFGDTVIFR